MNSFIHVLGCGDAFSSGGKANTSFLIRHKSKTILLDCGATTLMRLKALGYKTSDIDFIIISHFHGDHFGGIPALILDLQFGTENATPFIITSPTGGKQRLIDLMECLYPGNGELVDKLAIQFHYYEENEELKFDDFRVKAWPVVHAPLSLPHGIKLFFDEVTISFSGDSRWTDALIDLSDEADIFILDCNFMSKTEAPHLDYQTLLENIHKLKAKKICLTHMGDEMLNSDKIMLEKLEDGQIIQLPN